METQGYLAQLFEDKAIAGARNELAEREWGDIRAWNMAATIREEQTGSSDISFSGSTITSAGAVTFTDIKKGDYIYVSGTASENGSYIAASDGATSTVVVTTSFIGDSSQSATITHSIPIRGDRNRISGASWIQVAAYSADPVTSDERAELFIAPVGGSGALNAAGYLRLQDASNGAIRYVAGGLDTGDLVISPIDAADAGIQNRTSYQYSLIIELKWVGVD